MTQRKVTLVWDDEEDPIVEQGMSNRPSKESKTQYIRKCVEFYETNKIDELALESLVLERLTAIEGILKSGTVFTSSSQAQTSQEQEDMFDNMLEQIG